MKYLIFTILLLSTGCGIDVHGHVDPVTINPVQVQVSTTINYEEAQAYCNNQCGGNETCATNCYDQFLAVLAAASATPISTPTPSPTP